MNDISSQRGRSSKHKGSRFERQICAALSLWLSGGRSKDLLWRSAVSGGRTTRRRGVQLRHVSGDICSIKEPGSLLTGQLHIECKHYRDLQLANFFLGKPSKLATFWQDCRSKAKQVYKQPMLIVRQNRMPVIILLRPDMWHRLAMPETAWYFANRLVVVGLLEEFLVHASASALSVHRRPTLDGQSARRVPLADL